MRLGDRPASHTPSRVTVVALAGAVVVLAAGLLVLGVIAPRGIPGRSYRHLDVAFTDAANLTPLSEVRIAGRRVGQVTRIAYRGDAAVARLQLDGDVAALRSDSRARIRLKGLLGQKFVELEPGARGRPLRDGAALPASRTSTTVELDNIVQTLDRPRRQALRAALRALGEGFLGRGEGMNAMLREVPAVASQLRGLSEAVLAREGAAERFFPSSESAAAAFDPVREDMARGYAPQARALRPFVDRRAAVLGVLDEAPGALGALRRGLDASVPLLGETARLARATTRVTRPAPAALRTLSALLRESRNPLRESRDLLRRTAGAVAPTLGALRSVEPLIEPSVKSMRSNVPTLAELGRRRCDVLAFGRNWRSALGLGVAGGGEVGPLNAWRFTDIMSSTGEEKLDGTAPASGIGRDPYPAPCSAVDQRLGR